MGGICDGAINRSKESNLEIKISKFEQESVSERYVLQRFSCKSATAFWRFSLAASSLNSLKSSVPQALNV